MESRLAVSSKSIPEDFGLAPQNLLEDFQAVDLSLIEGSDSKNLVVFKKAG